MFTSIQIEDQDNQASNTDLAVKPDHNLFRIVTDIKCWRDKSEEIVFSPSKILR